MHLLCYKHIDVHIMQQDRGEELLQQINADIACAHNEVTVVIHLLKYITILFDQSVK